MKLEREVGKKRDRERGREDYTREKVESGGGGNRRTGRERKLSLKPENRNRK